ncbi:nucleotidyltransferase family protein [Leptothrix sp. BB-4]
MKPSDVLDRQRVAVRMLVARHRASNPRVFGSVVHGTDHEGSDLDLLIDVQPDASLFDLGALQVELETMLGLKVDLLTPLELPQSFRASVLSEARPV